MKFSTTLMVLSMFCAIAFNQTIPTIPVSIQQTCGVFIDFKQKPFYQKQYNVLGGEAELSFDFKAYQITEPDASGISVTIDEKEAIKVPLKNSGQNIQVKVVLTKGKHVVKFTPYGVNNLVSLVVIRKILLKEKQCTAGWGNNLIINGQFDQGTCKNDICYFSISNFQSQFLPGWIPNPEVQIIKASVHYPKMGDTYVADLDARKNSCIKQKVSLKSGKYSLSFNTAAAQNKPFSTSGVQVKLSGLILKNIIPTNYENSLELIEFELTNSCSDHELQFCALGTSDMFGSKVDNVKLVQHSDCATETIIEY